MTAIVSQPPLDLGPLQETADKAKTYMLAAKSDNTRRAYAADWSDFTAWCADHGTTALPAHADTVTLYLTDLADRCKTGTVQRRVTAIRQAHAGHDDPTDSRQVREVMKGIRRTRGTVKEGRAPAVIEDIRRMVAALDGTNMGTRNRAILLIGFAGAFRRSELVALDVQHIRFSRDGLVVRLRRSKTDQEGKGTEKAIPYGSNPDTCPVRALQAWVVKAKITTGPLFREIRRGDHIQERRLSDRAIALVVKRCAQAAGLNPDQYSGHSLRAGFATTAGEKGVEERDIQRQTGHKSVQVLRGYIRHGSLFKRNAAAQVGL
ncbi:MAG: site-specific integrase [Anaerolineae bacterium]